MATPTKAKLEEQLRVLGVQVPENASSRDLQELLRKVKNLPARAPERQAAPAPPSGPPPLTPPRPIVAAPTGFSRVVRPSTEGTFVPRGRIPAVSSPSATSDHDQRPWDPLAGF